MNRSKNACASGLSAAARTCARARRIAALLVVLSLLGSLAGMAAPAAAQVLSSGEGNLRVMTYNVHEGTDYVEALTAKTFFEFVLGVTTILQNVRATNPPERADAIARQIAAAQPDLVSLQEVTQWFTCPSVNFQTCANPGGLTMEFDFLQLIQDALARQGQNYNVVVVATQFDLTAPGIGFLARANNRIAILARADLNPNQFQLFNVQTAHFNATLQVPTPLGITIAAPRTWASVDVKFHNTMFRFVATHLESVDPRIQIAQGLELLSGPANTSLPVIIAMDSNSVANDPNDPTHLTYVNFIHAGFVDAWSATNPSDPGFTCCQAPLVNNSVSLLTQRIDLILARGGWNIKAAELFGEDPADKTPSGLWPSDHAGVAARLHFGIGDD